MCLTLKEQTSSDFQIGHPICKLAGQSEIGRLVGQFANWQIGRNKDTGVEITAPVYTFP